MPGQFTLFLSFFEMYLYLELQHSHGDLEDDGGACVEEEVPEAEEDLHVHNAGKQREEPVQGDEGQLCNTMHTHTLHMQAHALFMGLLVLLVQT